LAELTISSTIEIARELGVEQTRFIRSSELGVSGAKTDRLLQVLLAVNAKHYISGPSARDYLDEDKLRDHGIGVEYMRYDYPEYAQFHPPFDGQVSILDLLFHTGPAAGRYIWGEAATR
jgi:hypothetical protein